MTNERAQRSGYVVLTGTAEREGQQFVSFCEELGVASCGDTADEALDNLGDALEVHLEALTSIGQLDRVLREKDIAIREDTLAADRVSVSIPPDTTVRVYARQVHVAGVA